VTGTAFNLQQVDLPQEFTKQHRRGGTVAEVLDAMRLQEERPKALANF